MVELCAYDVGGVPWIELGDACLFVLMVETITVPIPYHNQLQFINVDNGLWVEDAFEHGEYDC